MDQNQGWLIWMTYVTPVADLTIPVPLMVRPPVDILLKLGCVGDTLGRWGLADGWGHRVLER
jgi:hypothetical protein